MRFWDYRGQVGNLRGRVCLPFSLAWGLLTAAAVLWVEPWAAALSAAMPPWLTWGLLLVFTADTVVTVFLLGRTGDIDALGRYIGR